MLTEPLKVRGILRFIPPATLEKLVTDPLHERYVIQGDRVTFESQRTGGDTFTFARRVSGSEEFCRGVPYESDGRGRAVKNNSMKSPSMGLLPNGRSCCGRWIPAGKSVVDYLLFTGSDGRIFTIASIRFPDGDRTVMTLLWRTSR